MKRTLHHLFGHTLWFIRKNWAVILIVWLLLWALEAAGAFTLGRKIRNAINGASTVATTIATLAISFFFPPLAPFVFLVWLFAKIDRNPFRGKFITTKPAQPAPAEQPEDPGIFGWFKKVRL